MTTTVEPGRPKLPPVRFAVPLKLVTVRPLESTARSFAVKGTPACCGDATASHAKPASGPESATVKTSSRVSAPAPLVAVMLPLKVPAIVGVPLMSPVLVFTPRPGGSGEAA